MGLLSMPEYYPYTSALVALLVVVFVDVSERFTAGEERCAQHFTPLQNCLVCLPQRTFYAMLLSQDTNLTKSPSLEYLSLQRSSENGVKIDSLTEKRFVEKP